MKILLGNSFLEPILCDSQKCAPTFGAGQKNNLYALYVKKKTKTEIVSKE